MELNLTLAGTVKLKLTNITPTAGKADTSSCITYSGPIAYTLATGAQVPGITIIYKGASEEGAEFGGIEGYAYRRIGDSLCGKAHCVTAFTSVWKGG